MRSTPTRFLAKVAGLDTNPVRSNERQGLPQPKSYLQYKRSPSAATPIVLAARRVAEQLEDRLHLSVSKDVNGFTIVTPAVDSKLIYVASNGSDTNPGTIGAPVATVAQARTMIRDKMPDQILLRRGDTFTGAITQWTQSGRSASEPMVLGAYTDPNRPSLERPKVNSGMSSGFTNNYKIGAIKYIDILGIAFEASQRNYRNPPSNFTVNYRDDAQGGTYGLSLLGDISNIFVEDSSFQYYRTGMAVQELSPYGNPANFELRRSVVSDNYAVSYDASGSYVTSEGIYANGVNSLKLTENVFDHNGWVDSAFGNFGAIATIYNHNAYLNVHNNGLVVTGNIFANASSHGLQARAGGIVTNNLFINNPIAMSYGYVNGEEKDGGVYGEVSGNVIYGARNISSQQRGWGLEIGNTRSIANGGGTVVKNNIYSGGDYGTSGQPAIQLSFGSNSVNPTKAVGINDLTVQNNVVYGWTKGVYINPGFANGGTSRYALNNISILNNEFQEVFNTPVVIHGTSFNAAVESWRGNRYALQSSTTSASTPFFQLRTNGVLNNQTLAQWQALVEPTAVTTPKITYPDPTRSPATYNQSIGGTNSIDAFLAEARKLSSKNYRTNYTAVAAENYIKSGFSGQRIDSLPPGASLVASDITAGGATTQSLTITWTDDNQVNLSSITNGDVIVTGPGGYSQTASLVSATPNADGSIVTAIYTVPAAAGAWSAAANGAYTVTVQANQVTDKAGNSAPAGTVGTFTVNISAGAPTASLVATNITTTSGSATLTVTYAVAGGTIDASSIDGGDLTVTDPAGNTFNPQLVSITPAGNGSPLKAVYTLDAPGDGWTPDNNGLYTVTLLDGAVSTVSGVATGQAKLGTFTVNVTVPNVVATAPDVIARSKADKTVTVTYSDVNGINASTIDAKDIRIEGYFYYADYTTGLTLVSKSGAGTPANPLVAVYKFPAPSPDGFTPDYNGTWNILLNNEEVSTPTGNFANSGLIGSFELAIDEVGPAPVDVTSNIYKPSAATSIPVVINYNDPSGIDLTSLGTGDISVVSPTGIYVDPVLQSVSGTGVSVTATYLYPMPSGINASESGSYQITLNPNQVKDKQGNFSPEGFFDYFTIGIDSTPPVLNSSNSGVPDNLSDVTFFINFQDDPGVDTSTLDDADLRVIGPNGFNQPVTFTSFDSPDGSYIAAVYTLPHPVGGWSPTDNGTYTLVVQPNQIADLSGTFVTTAANPVDTFTVNVPAAVRATFDPVTPSPAAPGLDQITFHFNQVVNGLDLSDLTLTKDGGSNLLTGNETLATTDNGTGWSLSGLSPSTLAGGRYTLTLVASGSSISGEGGGFYLADTSLVFVVDGGVPTVTATAPAITVAGTTPQTIVATYTDDSSINTSTIGDGDLVVTGPNNYSENVTLKFVDSGSNGKTRVATYSLPAPTGGWTAAANGTYAVRMRPGQVSDVNGNFIDSQFVTSFDVNVTAVDTTPPTFTVTSPVVTSKTSAATMTIVWSDPSGINASTIGTGDVKVTGPSNNSSYAQVGTLVSSTTSGTSVTAVYSVPAPTGGWTAAMNGLYAVLVRPSQVADTLGNNVADWAFVGSITVGIGTTTDTTPPTATITAISTSRTTAIASDTIVFSEAVSGFDISDLTLTRSGGANLLTSAQSLTTSDNKTFTLNNLTSLTGTAGTYVLSLKSSGTAIADLANNAMTTGASTTWVFSSSTSTPTLTSVSPSPVTTSTSAQSITLTGTNFATNATVKLVNLTTGTTYTPTVTSRSTTQIVVSQVVGSSSSSWTAQVLNGTTGSATVSFLVQPAAALGITIAPNPVTGTTATLTATNAGTNTATKFAWSATTIPSGATAPTFSANNSNAAKSSVITFKKAGSYTLKLTSTTGSTVKTATVTFTVNSTTTTISVTPATGSLTYGQTIQLSASAKDQFGTAMATQPTFTWTTTGGTISSKGLYAAPASGGGTFTAKATSGQVSGSASFTVTSIPVKINFQPASATTVSGYLVDSGLTYAARNGQSYGWSVSETSNAVDRNKASTQLLDTNIGILSGAKWEILVPNGTYSVKVSVGDGSVATTNTIRLEGTTVFSAVKLAANAFSNKTVTVKVTDGKLTMDAGSAAALATRVNYIELTQIA